MDHNWQAGHEPDDIEALRIQLAVAQARIVELREALSGLREYSMCHDTMARLLDNPDDTTALDAALEAERERCAKVLSEHPGHVPSNKWNASSALGACEQVIRSMT